MAENPGVERMLQRIRDTIESGSYYEAQQMYKTAYARYKAKNLKNESLHILKQGAKLQLEKRQINCGTELGNLLIEDYELNAMEPNEESVASLRDLVALLPRPATHTELNAGSAEVEEGNRFLNRIIRWIKRQQVNSPYFLEFNSSAGDYLMSWEGGEALGRITIYFVRGKNWLNLAKGEKRGVVLFCICCFCGLVLVSCLELSDVPNEEDLFICRCVLQLFVYSSSSAVDSVQSARELLNTYSTIRALPQTPLIHFTQFLIEALEVPSEQLMEMLMQKYSPVLNRDKHLDHLLKKIKHQFFPRQSDNLLANVLGGILQGSTT
eukprot:g2825.t1